LSTCRPIRPKPLIPTFVVIFASIRSDIQQHRLSVKLL
jgi:hypothetical protein